MFIHVNDVMNDGQYKPLMKRRPKFLCLVMNIMFVCNFVQCFNSPHHHLNQNEERNSSTIMSAEAERQIQYRPCQRRLHILPPYPRPHRISSSKRSNRVNQSHRAWVNQRSMSSDETLSRYQQRESRGNSFMYDHHFRSDYYREVRAPSQHFSHQRGLNTDRVGGDDGIRRQYNSSWRGNNHQRAPGAQHSKQAPISTQAYVPSREPNTIQTIMSGEMSTGTARISDRMGGYRLQAASGSTSNWQRYETHDQSCINRSQSQFNNAVYACGTDFVYPSAPSEDDQQYTSDLPADDGVGSHNNALNYYRYSSAGNSNLPFFIPLRQQQHSQSEPHQTQMDVEEGLFSPPPSFEEAQQMELYRLERGLLPGYF